ncbi:MAG TPA: PAS domain-containing protein [Terrimicrobiaceae bacterium]|nr:PAS domain-containing protein [Terrimicrobiaceae bacterium]
MNPPREDSVRRAESEIRDVIDAIPAMVWIAAPDGKGTFINRAWTEYLGLSLEEILGFDWPRTVHPDDVDRYLAAWRLSLASGQPLEQEVRYRRADGEYRWFLSRALPVRNKRGEIVEWYGIAADIEDRKRAQEAERRRESELRELIEALPAMAWSASPDSSCTYVNKNWTEYTGLSLEETVGSGWLRAVHQQDAEQHLTSWQKSVATGQPFQNEVRFRRAADGRYRWFTVCSVPLLDEQGRILKWYGIAVDVEDRKRAEQAREEAARRSERELREVIERIPAMVWMTLPDGTATFVNRGWTEYLGLSLEDILGWGWSRTVHPDDVEQFVRKWRASLATGQPLEGEVRVRRADGEYRCFLVRVVPAYDEQGKILNWYGAGTEIEDQKRAEQALKRSEAYLAEAQKLTKTGSWAWDPRANLILYWSDEIYRIFGFNPADGIPSMERFWQRVHPDDRTGTRALVEEGIRNKVEHSYEYRIMLADGSIRYVRNLRRPVINDAGEVIEMIGATVDITQRKQAEEAKKAAEELASSHVEVIMRSLDVLAKEPAPEKYIAEILRTIAQPLRAHRVMLWLREQNDDSLRLHTVIVNDEPIVTDEADHPFVRTSSSWKQIPFFTGMLATKSTAVCEDVEDDSRLTSEWRKYLTSRKTKRLVSVPMFLAGEFRGFISIHHSEAGTYRPDEIELAQSLAQHVIMAVHGQQVAEQERQAAILKERARLARDVHDTLAQGFTGVILQMEAAEEALFDENPDAAVQRVRRAREIARESLGEARRSVHALRPQALDKSGFAEALQSMLKNTTAGASLRTSFSLEGEPRVLPAKIEETLLRIGQEALSNALKHAHPTEFHIRLCFKSDTVHLELFDNGKGFVVGQTNGGVGLLGMKERAEQIGATLTISSEPGKGTKIIAVSPNKIEAASS